MILLQKMPKNGPEISDYYRLDHDPYINIFLDGKADQKNVEFLDSKQRRCHDTGKILKHLKNVLKENQRRKNSCGIHSYSPDKNHFGQGDRLHN